MSLLKLTTGVIADNLPADTTSAGGGAETSATQYTTLSALGITNLLCEYDFAVASSWPGTGQYVYSLVDAPSDGSSATGWTLFLGSATTVEAGDPVFKGSAGTIGSYVCALTGDRFTTCGSATFSPTLKAIGSIGAGTDWWVAAAVRFGPYLANLNQSYICGNYGAAGRQGFALGVNPGSTQANMTSAASFSLCRGSTVNTFFTSAFNVTIRTSTGIGDDTPKDTMMIFSYRASDKTFMARRWVSGDSPVSVCIDAVVSSNSNGSPIRVFHVFSYPAGGVMSSSSRLYSFAMGNSFITTAEMSVIYKEWGSRRQVTYDPNV